MAIDLGEKMLDVKISDILFRTLNFLTLFISFRTKFDKNFRIIKVIVHEQNTNYTETTSMKTIVLLHPQGFPATRK